MALKGGLDSDQEMESLLKMREKMLDSKPQISAAICIGGKQGVVVEYELFRQRFPDLPIYPLKRPGGAAASLRPLNIDSRLAAGLSASAAYWAVSRHIIADIAVREM